MRLGRFLRRTSLDELPNVIDVLVGQMKPIAASRPQSIPYSRRDNTTFSETFELDREYVNDRNLARFGILRDRAPGGDEPTHAAPRANETGKLVPSVTSQHRVEVWCSYLTSRFTFPS